MTRISRDDTRLLLLQTGVRLLMERGLEGGCANVGMAEVLADIEQGSGRRITNASIYGRIWASQADFHKDLLLEAASEFPSAEEQATRIAAQDYLATAVGTPTHLLREICRRIGVVHFDALATSRSWQTWLAIWALTVSTPTLEDDLERGPTIAKHHEQAVEAFAEVLSEILAAVGATMRAGLTVDQLAMSMYALSEGLVLHQRFSRDDLLTVDVHGEHWTLFGVALEGIVNRFVHFDHHHPDNRHPDNRHPDNRHPDNLHADSRHADHLTNGHL
jgi:hypothetical protein